jgi:hypothetical protein
MKKSTPAERSRRGPPKLWHEAMQAKFTAGTLAAIEDVLKDGESRVAFVNEAVQREIVRRRKVK